ncbi:hypothetical protein VKT23_002615 [Stygiomarasmius scandens]|uniref:Glycoside hydrolase family 79 protein n=1 Tax=Marasmiellus scandens TaxID=2682957 RepID=A0ABR1K2J2_9AGAR
MHLHPCLSCIFLSLAAVTQQNVLAADAAAAIRISPQPSAPDDAKSVEQGFVGFGIEMKSFPQYAGSSFYLTTSNDNDAGKGIEHANEFSKNLLSTFTSKTGAPVHIRIGGTSMDNSKFDPTQTNQATKNTTDSSKNRLHTKITIGAPWIESFKHWDNVLYTLQVPLARKNLSNAIEFARACIDAMPNHVQDLEAIEIGNEPNLYPRIDRNDSYGPVNYAREWDRFAGAIVGNISRLNGKEWFQAMTFSSEVDPNGPWTV